MKAGLLFLPCHLLQRANLLEDGSGNGTGHERRYCIANLPETIPHVALEIERIWKGL